MSMLVAGLIFVPLLAMAAAHLLWSLGLSWPIRDRELLAKAVIGTPAATRVPRLRAMLVAIVSFATGLLALALADDAAGGWILSALAVPAAGLFLARGGLAFTRPWQHAHPEPAFASSDRRVYGPVCLVIGCGLVVLILMRLF